MYSKYLREPSRTSGRTSILKAPAIYTNGRTGLGARRTPPRPRRSGDVSRHERLQTVAERLGPLGFDFDSAVLIFAPQHSSVFVHPGKLPTLVLGKAQVVSLDGVH